MYKYIISIFFATVILCCCSKGPDAEAKASEMLDKARALLAAKKFTAAKDSVLHIRSQYPTAINSRKAGILLLDSIEMLHAEDSVQCMQMNLYNAEKQYEEMDANRNHYTLDEMIDQRTKVFHLKQKVDELQAKARFFYRKIEIDIQVQNQMQEQE